MHKTRVKVKMSKSILIVSLPTLLYGSLFTKFEETDSTITPGTTAIIGTIKVAVKTIEPTVKSAPIVTQLLGLASFICYFVGGVFC